MHLLAHHFQPVLGGNSQYGVENTRVAVGKVQNKFIGKSLLGNLTVRSTVPAEEWRAPCLPLAVCNDFFSPDLKAAVALLV